jgi:hypothetical protein
MAHPTAMMKEIQHRSDAVGVLTRIVIVTSGAIESAAKNDHQMDER